MFVCYTLVSAPVRLNGCRIRILVIFYNLNSKRHVSPRILLVRYAFHVSALLSVILHVEVGALGVGSDVASTYISHTRLLEIPRII